MLTAAVRMLVLGGTAWLGAAVATRAIARGHDVACLARGVSGEPPRGTRFVRADRTRPGAYDAVTSATWDAVIDLADDPDQVRGAVEALDTARFVLVSTVSVYADTRTPGQDEGAPVLDPDGDTSGAAGFGRAKVRCERIVQRSFGDRALVVRPGLIGGPGDASGRTTYWPWRFAHADPRGVLAPDAIDRPTQVVDVRDLAAFLVAVAERGLAGVLDAVGPVVPFGQHLALAAQASGSGAAVRAASDAWLLGHRVTPWAGPRSLPLWLPDPGFAGFAARRGTAAVHAGLGVRPLADTLRDGLAWEEQQPAHPHGAGLSDVDERVLLDALT